MLSEPKKLEENFNPKLKNIYSSTYLNNNNSNVYTSFLNNKTIEWSNNKIYNPNANGVELIYFNPLEKSNQKLINESLLDKVNGNSKIHSLINKHLEISEKQKATKTYISDFKLESLSNASLSFNEQLSKLSDIERCLKSRNKEVSNFNNKLDNTIKEKLKEDLINYQQDDFVKGYNENCSLFQAVKDYGLSTSSNELKLKFNKAVKRLTNEELYSQIVIKNFDNSNIVKNDNRNNNSNFDKFVNNTNSSKDNYNQINITNQNNLNIIDIQNSNLSMKKMSSDSYSLFKDDININYADENKLNKFVDINALSDEEENDNKLPSYLKIEDELRSKFRKQCNNNFISDSHCNYYLKISNNDLNLAVKYYVSEIYNGANNIDIKFEFNGQIKTLNFSLFDSPQQLKHAAYSLFPGGIKLGDKIRFVVEDSGTYLSDSADHSLIGVLGLRDSTKLVIFKEL